MKQVTLPFLLSSLLVSPSLGQSCPDYSTYSKERNKPYSAGRFELAYQRPDPSCRTFISPTVDEAIRKTSSVITDPDLYRLFENTFPNTLDTAIKWRGHARNNSNEELAFVVTGDINAMWLRDSANQLKSYLSLLVADSSSDSLASLFRGVINLQARYILTSPYCNAFQPPEESNLEHAPTGGSTAQISPPYDTSAVFECKFELDSLASFLDISYSYFSATDDSSFFGEHQWISTVHTILDTARSMMVSTYRDDGSVAPLPYTFQQETRRATETLANDGTGSPAANGIGLIRSAFRPSDDTTMLPFLIPSNMMFAKCLEDATVILDSTVGKTSSLKSTLLPLRQDMWAFAQSLRAGIAEHGIVPVRSRSQDGGVEMVYAYEVDGFGSAILMDDANLPSLLAAPLMGYLDGDDPIYQRTRTRILSYENPYFMRGPALNAVGGPHVGPGMAWPMASIVRILTSDDDAEIENTLGELVASTAGLGLIHESVNSSDSQDWTRQWFSWANGLFGQMILDLASRKPHVLKQSYQ
ncbi:hypothetical protein QBC39DRAFT_314802 [Podospora conica]|nr:hypothetical protein QBC39DRAFT_314802 [Schizothecium conicum]